MCENSVGIIMYANLRNCTSLYRFFMFSILQMYENTITLKFATAKKYDDYGSAKADLFLPWMLLFSVSVNNWINLC